MPVAHDSFHFFFVLLGPTSGLESVSKPIFFLPLAMRYSPLRCKTAVVLCWRLFFWPLKRTLPVSFVFCQKVAFQRDEKMPKDKREGTRKIATRSGSCCPRRRRAGECLFHNTSSPSPPRRSPGRNTVWPDCRPFLVIFFRGFPMFEYSLPSFGNSSPIFMTRSNL